LQDFPKWSRKMTETPNFCASAAKIPESSL
jgi:hypothetical protein